MNRAKCKLCGDVIESLYRRHFVSCRCKEIFVDGGNDFPRWGANNIENFIRILEEEEDEG